MRFWWVNQGQTYAQEFTGSYLWSPKRTRAGHARASYDRMPETRPGDLIVHYAGGAVRSHSVVVRGGHSARQPNELRATDMWDDDGWRVDVEHQQVIRPVPRARARTLGPDEAPFTVTGTIKQDYLFEISREFSSALIELLSGSAPTLDDDPAQEPTGRSGRAAVTTVDLESGDRLTFATTGAAPSTAQRDEWSLVDLFVSTLGVEPVRRRYLLEDGTPLYSDLWLEAEGVLMEAKANASRGAIREAIGQLADYAEKEPGPIQKVLLVPEAPAPDLLRVLHGQRIVAVWPIPGSWQRSDRDKPGWSV